MCNWGKEKTWHFSSAYILGTLPSWQPPTPYIVLGKFIIFGVVVIVWRGHPSLECGDEWCTFRSKLTSFWDGNLHRYPIKWTFPDYDARILFSGSKLFSVWWDTEHVGSRRNWESCSIHFIWANSKSWSCGYWKEDPVAAMSHMLHVFT